MAKQRQRPVFISPGQRFKLSCWMVKYAKEISGLQRKEIAERAFADTGIKVSAAQISDIAKATEVELTYKRADNMKCAQSSHATDRHVVLAKILRRVITECSVVRKALIEMEVPVDKADPLLYTEDLKCVHAIISRNRRVDTP